MGLELGAAVLAFIAVASLGYSLVVRSAPGGTADARLAKLAKRSPGRDAEDDAAVGLMRNSVSSVAFVRDAMSSRRWVAATSRSLEQAGIGMKVSEYLLIRLLIATLLAIVVLVIASVSAVGVLLALAAAAAGYLLPGWYVGIRINRRQREIGMQLAEALQLIANALRSGFAFLQAVRMAASQMSPPISDEFRRFLQDTSLGSPTDDALKAMAVRCGGIDMEMVVTTILVQRTTGGRLSEVLESIAETIRDRERLYLELHALTAQQRLTGNILACYPIVLGVLFYLISPSLMSLLWTDPLGRILLGIAIALQLIGILAMRRILAVEV